MNAISPVTGPASLQKGVSQATVLQTARPDQAAAAMPEPAPRRDGAGPPIVNPSLRFDMRLGLVVVEFFDDAGEIANSVPSPRQLKAYEAGMNVRSGPMPLPRDLPAGTDEERLAVVA
jgi:hypothetical protein